MKHLRICLLFIAFGCEQPDPIDPPFECPTMTSDHSFEGDTIFYGRWRYSYSLVICNSQIWPEADFFITDTVYPNQLRPGYPGPHPEIEVEISDSLIITVDGNRKSYCKRVWNSYYFEDYGNPLLYSSASDCQSLGHSGVNNQEIVGVGFDLYSALGKDTAEVILLDIIPQYIDSSCGFASYTNRDFFIRVH